jgi:hypothetical protein
MYDRDVGGFFAFEDAAGIDALLAIGLHEACAVADQAAGISKLTKFVDRRDGVARSQGHDRTAPAVEERVGADKQRRGPYLHDIGEGRFDLGIAGIEEFLS